MAASQNRFYPEAPAPDLMKWTMVIEVSLRINLNSNLLCATSNISLLFEFSSKA